MALGRSFLGIKPKRPVKSLLISSENNRGNLAEAFQDVAAEMDLRPDQIACLKTKIVITLVSKTDRYARLMHYLVEKHKPDLVFAT